MTEAVAEALESRQRQLRLRAGTLDKLVREIRATEVMIGGIRSGWFQLEPIEADDHVTMMRVPAMFTYDDSYHIETEAEFKVVDNRGVLVGWISKGGRHAVLASKPRTIEANEERNAHT